MTPLDSALAQITSELDQRHQSWALIGGLAVSARAEPRFTRDIDVAIAVAQDADAETLVHNLLSSGYMLETLLEHETGRLATTRLISTRQSVGAKILVDLMFASSGLEPEIVAAAEPIEILAGMSMPVAQLGHLVALKLLARDEARRPQDQADLLALLAVATADDVKMAREGCAIITERGFNRERDLLTDLDEVLTLSSGR